MKIVLAQAKDFRILDQISLPILEIVVYLLKLLFHIRLRVIKSKGLKSSMYPQLK